MPNIAGDLPRRRLPLDEHHLVPMNYLLEVESELMQDITEFFGLPEPAHFCLIPGSLCLLLSTGGKNE